MSGEVTLGAQVAANVLGADEVAAIGLDLVDTLILVPPGHQVDVVAAADETVVDDTCTVAVTASTDGRDAVVARYLFRAVDPGSEN